jgi:hypothetical protein
MWSTPAGARRLVGEVTNASRPLRTRQGALLVQRGADGEPVSLTDHTLRERRDALHIDAVDPSTGEARAVWTGHGQIAFLACALEGDEVLLWHLDGPRAELLALDVARGVARASGANPSVPEMSSLFDRVAAGPTRYGALGWDFAGRTTVGAGNGWCGGAGRATPWR